MSTQIPKHRLQLKLPRMYLVPLVAMTVAAASFAGCGSTTGMSSSWNNSQVRIDGDANEWGSGLINLKDTKVFLGIRNDQDFIYLCLTSPDRQFGRQLIGAGLTVWFESEDGKRMGIRYPIGMMKQDGQTAFDPDGGHNGKVRERIADQGLQDLEILGPGKDDRNLFSIVQDLGIGVKVGGSQNSTVYELKVPLEKSANHPYAVNAGVGSTVKIDIETGKFGPEMRPGGGEGIRGGGRRPRDGGGPPGGGMPGGGMPGGGERSGGQMPSRNRPEPLSVSVAVQLAGPIPEVEH